MEKRGQYRQGIFFVVYRKKKDNVEYLILKRRLHWTGWEFPKAGLKIYERKDKVAAVVRELKEEAGGCEPIKILNFKAEGKYKYGGKIVGRPWIGQTYTLFAVEVKCPGRTVKIDKHEHSEYKWLGFEKAMEILTWPNQRKCLEIVHKKIKRKRS
jgi:8-oxo-dGTP pyrophosphatase MutT (NUDIX family)